MSESLSTSYASLASENFFSAPGSAYWGFRSPTAEWIVEASDGIVDAYMKHMPKHLPAMAKRLGGGGAPRMPRRRESTHLSIVWDELQRRMEELMGGLKGQKKGEK